MPSSPTGNPLAQPQPWDWVAPSYVEIVMPLMSQFAELAVERAQPQPHMRVLDVATGPGTVACRVAPHVRQVDAVDFSPQMVARCQQRARQLGVGNVSVTQADGQALPFPDCSFDAGFSMFGLMFFPDRVRGFAELNRVLRPGARAFVTSWAPVALSPLMLARIAAVRAADPNAPSPQKNVLTLEDRECFVREMEQAGFVDVAVEPVFRDREFRNLDELCQGLTSGNAPFEIVRRELGEAAWQERLRLMREHLERTYRDFPMRLGSTAYLGSGRRA